MRYNSSDKYASIDLSSMSELEILVLREKLLSAPAEELDIELIERCNDIILKGAYVTEREPRRHLFQRLRLQICADEAAASASGRKIRARVALCVILVLVFMLTITGFAMGLLRVVWNSEFFFINHLSPMDEAQPSFESGANTLTTVWGEEFVNALIENDIPVALPTWIPEGYELEYMTVSNQRWTALDVLFTAEERRLNIRICKYPSSPIRIVAAKNEDEIMKYTLNDVDYYISSNANYNQIFWYIQDYGIHIYGDLEIAELEKMIGSMGG